ncbi:acyl-coA-sterol acyltransferase [Schizosaccharomyces cryophilus OY26]|uniref:O-acyltransferase n=1 Tax=Schizosaccharomyces cryophilus (strain OY26 / ATCC MYA-4695 / CBS 11777 / NBRC 106824 / NRRL Y48691) TaxID=653667 RepID=S9X450_SCHCR|nr:acyl-coA-sterol acyltransferase [Schizosaccharomyces cryophilus OY26]EPY51822.1 acyl-coA-sterol acyltransferase [Schizosaccharomyces cryophilus OY26]
MSESNGSVTPSPGNDVNAIINIDSIHPTLSLLKALPECNLVIKKEKDTDKKTVRTSFPLKNHKDLLLSGRVYHDYDFKPRKSIMDRATAPQEFAKSEFRGFYVLFWLSMFVWIVQLYAKSYWLRNTILGLPIAKIVFRQFFVLFGSDFIMVLLTFFSFGLQWCVEKRYIVWANTGYAIQLIWQGCFTSLAVYWVIHRKFPVIQCLFFTLHCAVLVMKQFSYAQHLGYMSKARELHEAYGDVLQLIRNILKEDSDEGQMYRFELEYPDHTESIDALKAEEVVALTMKYLSRQLRSEKGNVAYPNNLTLLNYIDYLLVPSLVYSLEFPRVSKFNLKYLLVKVASIFGVLIICLALVDWYFLPTAESVQGLDFMTKLHHAPFLMSRILFPAVILYLLLFYLTFDCILNAFAEITKFADREFYGPWWNTVTWDEFARLWNIPVHVFLMRHVYHSSRQRMNKTWAVFLTFLLSALVHEFVMLLVTGKLRCYILFMQLLQLPLYDLCQMSGLKNRALLGNLFFWIGIFTGPSFLCILYIVF